MATQAKLVKLSKEIKKVLTERGKLQPKQVPDEYLDLPDIYDETDFDLLFPHWRDQAPPNKQYVLASVLKEGASKRSGGSIVLVIKIAGKVRDIKIASKDIKKGDIEGDDTPYLSGIVDLIKEELEKETAVAPQGMELEDVPPPKIEPITAADVEQIEAEPVQEAKQVDYEKRVQELLTPAEFTQIMGTLKKALHDDDLGIVQIFDDKGVVVATADKENDALQQLVKLIEEDMSTGQKKASFIGNKYAMVSIRKGPDNTPLMGTEVYELLENLDLKKVADRQKLYTVVELMQKGIKAKDYKDMAKKSIHETYKDPNAEYMDKSGKLTKTRTYKLQDIEKLKKFASKYY